VLQADEADLKAFEAATASARSQGLFFKNLYEPERDGEQSEAGSSSGAAGSSGSRSKTLLDPVAARQAAAVVASSAEEEVSSPFRMYLFGAMAAVLALVVGQGGWGHGCRHTITACISCGWPAAPVISFGQAAGMMSSSTGPGFFGKDP
jgi:hypothetical protein